MIRTLLALIPAERRNKVGLYTVLAVVSVVLRAVGVVLLVPLVAALFSTTPGDAWGWLGWLTAVTVAGWVIDTRTAALGFDIGFAVLDNTQHDMADRLPDVRLDWLSQDNTATTRAAIAATGPELVGLVVNLLTPLIGAVLLPAAISLALLTISVPLGLAALAGVAVLLGALWSASGYVGAFSRAMNRIYEVEEGRGTEHTAGALDRLGPYYQDELKAYQASVDLNRVFAA